MTDFTPAELESGRKLFAAEWRFVAAAGITEQAPRMAWMLVRLGYAKTPPLAYRRGIEELVVP